MDLHDRIRRRQPTDGQARLVHDYDAINPAAHVDEPTGRGPILERLLDYLDPVFEGRLPPTAYVWGPPGSGKSATVTALFDGLDRLLTRSGSVVHTATRTRARSAPTFVYVDARRADTDFALYHAVLDALLEESVPEHGVGTDALRSRLVETLRRPGQSAVVAVDHVDEHGTRPLAELPAVLGPATDALTWAAVGRTPPDELAPEALPPERIAVPGYDRHALVDVLTSRASEGLAGQAFEHEQFRRLADWAAGDAHDALAALFGAADRAAAAGRDRVLERDLAEGMGSVPRPCVALGRVLTLSANRQLALRTLVDLDESAATSVGETAEAIAARPDVDLSAATVKRFLYELAEAGITERVRSRRTDGAGRPPSRIEPRFPTLVFRRLYDLDSE